MQICACMQLCMYTPMSTYVVCTSAGMQLCVYVPMCLVPLYRCMAHSIFALYAYAPHDPVVAARAICKQSSLTET